LLPCFLLSQFLTSSSFFTSFFPSLLPSFLPSFLSASLVSILSFSRRGVVCPFARARAHASGRASERASERAQPLAIRPRGLTGGARRHNGTRIPRSGDVLASEYLPFHPSLRRSFRQLTLSPVCPVKARTGRNEPITGNRPIQNHISRPGVTDRNARYHLRQPLALVPMHGNSYTLATPTIDRF